MKILVRLPNWLGDMIMSTAFLNALRETYPESEIDIVVKKELAGLMRYVEQVNHIYSFSKKEYPGIKGLYLFGKKIAQEKKYDLFFSLPDSFSSALMGYFTGSKVRIGYKKEFRNLLLTHSYKKIPDKHRVEEYADLLCNFSGKALPAFTVGLSKHHNHLSSSGLPKSEKLIFNINSEAQSRKMPLELAAEIITNIRKKYPLTVLLTGTNKDAAYVAALEKKLQGMEAIYNYAGKTSLAELTDLVSQADHVVSTDSGIAHLGNAFLKNTVVLFGAGNEDNTSPYNKTHLKIIRKEGLDCAPCLSNTCKFGEPKCLQMIEADKVVKAFEILRQEN